MADSAWNDPVKLRAPMRRLQAATEGGTVDFDGDGRRRDEYVRAWRRIEGLLDQAAKAERAAAADVAAHDASPADGDGEAGERCSCACHVRADLRASCAYWRPVGVAPCPNASMAGGCPCGYADCTKRPRGVPAVGPAYRMQCQDGELCRRNCTFDAPCERAAGVRVCEHCGAIEANGEAHGPRCPARGVQGTFNDQQEQPK